jgi:hypothetical protein
MPIKEPQSASLYPNPPARAPQVAIKIAVKYPQHFSIPIPLQESIQISFEEPQQAAIKIPIQYNNNHTGILQIQTQQSTRQLSNHESTDLTELTELTAEQISIQTAIQITVKETLASFHPNRLPNHCLTYTEPPPINQPGNSPTTSPTTLLPPSEPPSKSPSKSPYQLSIKITFQNPRRTSSKPPSVNQPGNSPTTSPPTSLFSIPLVISKRHSPKRGKFISYLTNTVFVFHMFFNCINLFLLLSIRHQKYINSM